MSPEEMLAKLAALAQKLFDLINAEKAEHPIVLEAVFHTLSTVALQHLCCAQHVANGCMLLSVRLATLASQNSPSSQHVH